MCGRYVTQNKKEIYIIISLFNGSLVLPKRQETLDLFVKGFNKWVTKGRILLEPIAINNRPVLPTLNDAWFAGFTFIFLLLKSTIKHCKRKKN